MGVSEESQVTQLEILRSTPAPSASLRMTRGGFGQRVPSPVILSEGGGVGVSEESRVTQLEILRSRPPIHLAQDDERGCSERSSSHGGIWLAIASQNPFRYPPLPPRTRGIASTLPHVR